MKGTNLKKIAGYVGMAAAVAVISLVVFSFIRDAATEKVDQDAAPTVEEVKASLEENQNNDSSEQAATETQNRSGQFSGANGYSVSGSVIVTDVNGQKVIKFEEDFSASSGPDLEVYLSKNNVQDGEGLGEFVSLRGLKSNNGAQVYNAPDNIDEFNSVVIWCRAFSVQFGAAGLN